MNQSRSISLIFSFALITAIFTAASAYAQSGKDLAFGVGVPSITEVMYHPEEGGAEFIELHNVGGVAINLAGMRFNDGIDFIFPGGNVLEPGGYAVLVSSESVFSARYPGVRVAGVYAGRLANSGETVELTGINFNVLVSFTYDDAPPWPVAADGSGYSLTVVDVDADPDSGRWISPSSSESGSSRIVP